METHKKLLQQFVDDIKQADSDLTDTDFFSNLMQFMKEKKVGKKVQKLLAELIQEVEDGS